MVAINQNRTGSRFTQPEDAAMVVEGLGVELHAVSDDLGGKVFRSVSIPDPNVPGDIRGRIMEKVGWVFKGDANERVAMAPDPIRFAAGMGRVGVNLAFLGDITERGLTPFDRYLEAWDTDVYPVGYASYKMFSHDVSADHAAPVALGGEEFMRLIAPSTKYSPIKRAELYDGNSSIISGALSYGLNGSPQNLEKAAGQVAKSLNRFNVNPLAVAKRKRRIIDSMESGIDRLAVG
jgi:hypothetical protein